MLRIFEAIKKSPFFNGNYPFRTPSKNASAEIKLTHNKFQQKKLPTHKTPLRGVMPQRMIYHPMIGISTLNFPLETPILA